MFAPQCILKFAPDKNKKMIPAKTQQVKQNVVNKKKSAVQLPLTIAGKNFLKCAFAEPDFSSLHSFIPDGNSDLAYMAHYKSTETVTIGPNTTVYYVKLPIPGSKFGFFYTTAGQPFLSTSALTLTYYDQYNSIFTGIADPTTQYESFRLVSNAMEIVNLNNEFTWAGSIEVFKFRPQLTTSTSNGFAMIHDIVGLESLNTNSADIKTFPVKEGVYTYLTNPSGKFDKTKAMSGLTFIPEQTPAYGSYGIVESIGRDVQIAGFDNGFEASVIRLTNPAAYAQTFQVKTWQCIEYIPTLKSVWIVSSTINNVRDQMALDLYRRLCTELPFAVPARENESFWERVVRTMKVIVAALKPVPGMVGAAATLADYFM